MAKTVNDTTPEPGERITYTISMMSFISLSNVLISDTLQAGLTFAGPVTVDPPLADATLAQEANDLPTLATHAAITDGTRITLTFPVTVNHDLPLGTVLTNTVSVTSHDVPTPTNASVSVAVPAPDLVLHQRASNGRLLPGQAITFTLNVKNQGNDQATQVLLSNTMPLSLTNHAFTSTLLITDTGTTPRYVWQVADLAPGASGIITLTGIVSPSLTSSSVLTNMAFITATNDIIPTNNEEQEVIRVTVPSISIWSSHYRTDEHTQNALITVSSNPINPYTDMTVNYATHDGTATAFEDYTPISGTLTIKATYSRATLSVPIIDDKIQEPEETFFLKLLNPNGATLGTRYTTTLTITDNDTPTATVTPTSTSTPTSTPTSTATPTATPTPTSMGSKHLFYLPLLRR